jgi:arabinose-5-phosphate isomerase
MESDLLSVAREVLEREARAIRDLAPRLNSRFAETVDRILKCKGKVIVLAVGKSGHIGRKIAATLASTGTPAFYVHPTEAIHGDLGMIRARDVVIAISHSGATAEVLAVMPVIQKIGAPVIAICRSVESPLGRASAICLETGVTEEADTLNLAPTSSTTVTLALGDALAVALVKCRGFGEEDFALYHPGGDLGRSLRRVREIMAPGMNPMVGEAATVREAVIVSKEFNLGAVSVVDAAGRLVGILTDGDIGRLFQRHPGGELAEMIDGPISAVMTTQPMAVDADTPGEKAVQLMEERRTYFLPVLETDGTVIGLVQMHDLIRAGFSFETRAE